MHAMLSTAVMAAALFASSAPAPAHAAGADEQASESRSVDAKVVKVQLGGIINLKLKQGASPSLMLYGDKRLLAKVNVSQSGDTVQIDTDSRGWTFGQRGRQELRAELTLPALAQFVSHGVGSSEIEGFSGKEVRYVLDGAGSVTVNSHYRNVSARLGGVGSMTLHTGDTDKVDLDLRGAGQIAIHGQCKRLRAELGGVGSLDARALRADAVELDMSGLGGASVHATSSANLRLSGLGSATVYGNPANRAATARGLGSVSWQ